MNASKTIRCTYTYFLFIFCFIGERNNSWSKVECFIFYFLKSFKHCFFVVTLLVTIALFVIVTLFVIVAIFFIVIHTIIVNFFNIVVFLSIIALYSNIRCFFFRLGCRKMEQYQGK